MDYEAIDTEVLIIGAGAAGLRTAIELADAGVTPLVVSKRAHGDAHTRLAAGGINAALRSRDEGDDWSVHAADTLREGHFIGEPEAVEMVAQKAPERILELAEWGCPFERTDDGALEQRFFGAHTYRRTCFVGDRTGKAIMETLGERAASLGVESRQGLFIAELIADEDRVNGAVGWDMDSGRAVTIAANAVVVAAGGCTGLYAHHSSRPDENTGDAIGLAWSVGATVRDMEFVQFHPTGMVWPASMRGRLVTEAVRAEGGRLYNAQGQRFMAEYAPDEMELAARDVVARAIADEIAAGRATDRGGMLLDISHRDRDYLQRRLPRMVERFDSLGIDISDQPMEVAPTAHYSMGGIKVDFSTGATSVQGLFAVGEATAGLHGANRLGGNSLAETVVFGQLTGQYIGQWLRDRKPAAWNRVRAEEALHHWAGLSRQAGEVEPAQLIEELKQLMEAHAGLKRSVDGLHRGMEKLSDLRRKSRDLRVFTTPGSRAFEEVCNVRHRLDTAELILRSAEMRRESRGAHFLVDYPTTDDVWRGSIMCRPTVQGPPSLDRQPLGSPSEPVRQALTHHLGLDYHLLE